jgi:hypothetical protein
MVAVAPPTVRAVRMSFGGSRPNSDIDRPRSSSDEKSRSEEAFRNNLSPVSICAASSGPTSPLSERQGPPGSRENKCSLEPLLILMVVTSSIAQVDNRPDRSPEKHCRHAANRSSEAPSRGAKSGCADSLPQARHNRPGWAGRLINRLFGIPDRACPGFAANGRGHDLPSARRAARRARPGLRSAFDVRNCRSDTRHAPVAKQMTMSRSRMARSIARAIS